MSAHVIVMIGLKGGMGRTTVGMLLAMAFARRGQKVVVIDADPQASAATWHSSNPTHGVTVVLQPGRGRPALLTAVQDAQAMSDVVIIDCPSMPVSDTDHAAICADLLLAPIPPGAPEVWATPRTLALVGRAQTIKPGLLFAGVINRARRTNAAEALIRELNAIEGLPLLKSRLSDRSAYSEAVLIPLTDEVAISEADALAAEVLGVLAKRPVEFVGRMGAILAKE
jgi:chromosome partitioning protein